MCEYLLTSINEKPLNDDERSLIEGYRAELAKILDADLPHSQADDTLSLFNL